MFKHIVVGCGGSPEASDAVALGETIAAATGAGLSLVGAFPTSFFPVPGVTDRKTLRAEATRVLRHARGELAPRAMIHTAADSSVPRVLRRHAEQWHADLVIVGSKPSAALGHAAISRRGRQLLYDAPFSLCIAARGLHERKPRLETIGVGYDGGPEATAALAAAAELARATHSRLLVRRVVEDIVPPLSIEWKTVSEEWSDLSESQRRVALVETEEALAPLALEAEASATIGDPGYELRALSETVDLMVVGSRRWGPIARLVSGGVGETLVADAGCSTLIVPRPSAAQRRRGARDAGARRAAVA